MGEEEEEEINKDEEEEVIDWKVGDRCLAIFSEDGERYKAKIVLLKPWRSAAVVQFVEYGDQEEVKFEHLSHYKRAKKRKGSGYLKHHTKSKRKKGRSRDGEEDRLVWSVDKSKDTGSCDSHKI